MTTESWDGVIVRVSRDPSIATHVLPSLPLSAYCSVLDAE